MDQKLRDQVIARNEQVMKLYNAGDMEALSNLYTEDAVMMPPGQESIQGREGNKLSGP